MDNEELLSRLLYEEESDSLDFKSEQYKFSKATDEDKSELLKDILAFSNSWRRTEAYILIGVKEVKGGKSLVVGISDELDDAQIQQFIQSKLNRPIHFSYKTTAIDDKKIGLISIPVQKRPVYLKKDFAKLKANNVYVRRGSSTAIALPEEIASMGKSDVVEVKKLPKLKAFIVDGKHDEKQLESINKSVIVAEIPKKDEFPKYGESNYPPQLSYFAMATAMGTEKNKSYYSSFAEHFKETQSFFSLKIGVRNDGNLVARDVRVILEFKELPKASSIFHERNLPERPKSERNLIGSIISDTPRIYNLSIDNIANGYKANIHFGKIQSKDSTICDECLCLKIAESSQISVDVAIYSDDLETPEKLNLLIDVQAGRKSYTVSELVKLADDFA